ncbi:MAG TPA: NAD(P)-binding protein [Chitinophagaceae bacterium]|jgi:choline dehydrogenase-like flavoprotein
MSFELRAIKQQTINNKRMNHYDIIIIGTGSGGSTMAYKLAPSGRRILILERGGFIPKEKENWDAHEVVTVGLTARMMNGLMKMINRLNLIAIVMQQYRYS